ncbi:MAG TPA: glycosyl hydrolase 108 family protein [Candidatus Syntrophosphaera sp.]|jgi:hypothetical protein|nr:glycosyl hydrolase 108 family protein [Candidatus Syntrophosphaera sp.]
MDYFDRIIEFTLKWEGGYNNDPNDPGGETNFGISKRYHPKEDIKNLTRERAIEIYRNEYWLRYKCDRDPYPNNVVIFEIAVNPGPYLLYRIPPGFDWKDLIIYRLDRYMDIVASNPLKLKYLHGWNNRTMDLYLSILHNKL